jgi:RsiW-degrading membrane proteinase PrsW (M82 family)
LVNLALLPLAIGPTVILTHVIYMLDRREREPVRNVIRYFGMGALSAPLAGLVENFIDGFLPGDADPGLPWPLRFLLVLVAVAAVEETGKFLLLNAAARTDRELDEPFDWIVYAVAVALGFAAVENLRVLWEGASTGWVRALTAVPSHALDGTMMGYHLARGMNATPRERQRRRVLALVEPTLWHAGYDFLLFQIRAHPEQGSSLFGPWLLLNFVQFRLAAARVKSFWDDRDGMPPPVLWPTHGIGYLRRGGTTRPPREDVPPKDDE